jgi:hypothetical protein
VTSLRYFVLFEFFVISICFWPALFGSAPVAWCLLFAGGSYVFVGVLLWITGILNDCGLGLIRTLSLWAPAVWLDKPEWMRSR